MADIKISELPDAGALTGAEEVPMVQGAATVKSLLSDIVGLFTGATLGANTFTGRQTLSYSGPAIDFYSTTGTFNEHWWRLQVNTNGDGFKLYLVSDDGLSLTEVFDITRGQMMVSLMSLQCPVAVNELFTMGMLWNITARTSPAALASGDTDNYGPTGFGSNIIFRLTPDAALGSRITGLISASYANDSIIRLVNIQTGATGTLTLAHQNAGSSAANRIICPGEVDLSVLAGGSVELYKDSVTGRWRVFQ